MIDVIIIGGGLAGLINSILIARAGYNVTLMEKNEYPFHRVCGEYISNEVIPFLEDQALFPSVYEPPQVDELELSATNGNNFIQKLDLGGFGISRYQYDLWLSKKAIESGVTLLEKTQAVSVHFKNELFEVETKSGEIHEGKIVIGAQGKRSKLDQSLKRSFLNEKSPYVGVKYHIQSENLPENRISLHNFNGGYCGVSKIEDEKFNVCYLTHRDALKKYGNIDLFENEVMKKNPRLKEVFDRSEFLFEKPEVINEITFSKQEPINNHIFMCGDSAGMITPLCGNGMAMSIHSAKILSDHIIQALKSDSLDREKLELDYVKSWSKQFKVRLWAGRKIQYLFGSGRRSSTGVFIGKYIKPVSRFLISQTHGQPFS